MKLHANMLAYARSLQTGEALFFGIKVGQNALDAGAVNRAALMPAEVQEISVRGTIGNYMSEKDFQKHNIEQANLQTIDRATLPAGCDRLMIKGSVLFLDNAMSPHAASDPEVISNLRGLLASYAARGGFGLLARRYLWNVLNARWLWRNFMVMTDKQVHVIHNGAVRLSADPDAIDRYVYPGDDAMEAACPGFGAMADEIAAALAGSGPVVSIEMAAVGALPEGSEVFPSEEYLSGEKANEIERRRGSKNGPGKVLSSIHVVSAGRRVRQATFHPQKVGNALRCVDEWHGSDDFGAVPADPYAAQTTRSIALRRPGKGSLYDFLSKEKKSAELAALVAGDTDVGDPSFGNAHYVVANLVRGGVFGGKE